MQSSTIILEGRTSPQNSDSLSNIFAFFLILWLFICKKQENVSSWRVYLCVWQAFYKRGKIDVEMQGNIGASWEGKSRKRILWSKSLKNLNSKNDVKTALTPLFKELWAISGFLKFKNQIYYSKFGGPIKNSNSTI